MDKDIARQVSNIMIELTGKMNQSILLVQENCSLEEFNDYRKKMGYVMGRVYYDFMLPIYRKYPDIEPPEHKE